MDGYLVDDLEELVGDNQDFLHVAYASESLQLVLMSLNAGEGTSEEVRAAGDQFLSFIQGKGVIWINGVATKVKKDHAVIIPADARYYIVNSSDKALRFFAVFSPPKYRDTLVHRMRIPAILPEAAFTDRALSPDHARLNASGSATILNVADFKNSN